MSILNDKEINQKLSRLAYEIIEQNTDIKHLYLAGINNNGYRFAELLQGQLKKIPQCMFESHLVRVRLNPAKPMDDEITLDIDHKSLRNKTVILVDDVANTGRTLFYAFKPFMALLLRKMQVAVLVDRKHKSFPVQVNYLGISLATTVRDHIEVNLLEKSNFSVKMI